MLPNGRIEQDKSIMESGDTVLNCFGLDLHAEDDTLSLCPAGERGKQCDWFPFQLLEDDDQTGMDKDPASIVGEPDAPSCFF